MGVLGWLRERFQANGGVPADVIARAIPLWQAARPLPTPHDYRLFADEGYRRNVLVYACIRELAESTAEARVRVSRRNRDGTLADVPADHPLCVLLERPNQEQSGFEFLERLVTHLNVAGNAYLHKARSRAGRVVQLWTLRPDRTQVKAGADGLVERYEHTVEGRGTPVPAGDIVHFRMPDPLDDYYGLSPIAVLARWGDVDNDSADYLRAFFLNQGQPAGLLKFKARVPLPEIERIRQLWKDQYVGEHGWHTVGVVDADVDFQPVGSTPDKLRLGAVWEESESRICMAFGTPPIVIGAHVGLMRSTFANYRQAVRSFWVETLGPMYKRVGQKLTVGLAHEFGPDLVVWFDVSGADALQESQDELRKFALDGWDSGLLLLNEARQRIGLSPMRGGDVLKQALTDVYAPATVEVQGRRVVGFFPVRRRNGGGPDVLALGPVQRHEIPADHPADEPEWKALHRAADERAAALTGAALRAWRDAAETVDAGALRRALDGRDAEGAVAAVPVDAGAERLERRAHAILLEILTEAGTVSVRTLDVEGLRFDATNERAVAWAKTRAAELVREVSEETRAAIREIIVRAFEEGLPPARSARLIQQVVGLTTRQSAFVDRLRRGWDEAGVDDATVTARVERATGRLRRQRAQTIARTETMRASNEGQYELWRQAADQGLVSRTEVKVIWITTPDDRTCPFCAPMDGQAVAFEGRFSSGDVKGEAGIRRLDPVVAPPLHPRCRCALRLVT